MNTTLKDWLIAEPGRERLFAQEQLIVAVAEHIWERMEHCGKNKSEIAAALDKSKAFITQLLNGTRNMTLRTLSDIAFALDAQVDVQFRSKSTTREWSNVETLRHPFTRVVDERTIQHNTQEHAETLTEAVKLHYSEAA